MSYLYDAYSYLEIRVRTQSYWPMLKAVCMSYLYDVYSYLEIRVCTQSYWPMMEAVCMSYLYDVYSYLEIRVRTQSYWPMLEAVWMSRGMGVKSSLMLLHPRQTDRLRSSSSFSDASSDASYDNSDMVTFQR